MLDKEILDKRNNIKHSVEKKKRKIEESIIDFQAWVGQTAYLVDHGSLKYDLPK